jgi:hypothetical protein
MALFLSLFLPYGFAPFSVSYLLLIPEMAKVKMAWSHVLRLMRFMLVLLLPLYQGH